MQVADLALLALPEVEGLMLEDLEVEAVAVPKTESVPEVPNGFVGAMRRMENEASPKHPMKATGTSVPEAGSKTAAPGPVNGQDALRLVSPGEAG